MLRWFQKKCDDLLKATQISALTPEQGSSTSMKSKRLLLDQIWLLQLHCLQAPGRCKMNESGLYDIVIVGGLWPVNGSCGSIYVLKL